MNERSGNCFSAPRTESSLESRSRTLTACFQASFVTGGKQTACWKRELRAMNLDGHEGGEQRLLVLTPTGADSRLAVQLLRRCGFNAEACLSSEQFYRELGSDLGALIIADEALTPELVDRLISILEDQPPWSDIPVIVH